MTNSYPFPGVPFVPAFNQQQGFPGWTPFGWNPAFGNNPFAGYPTSGYPTTGYPSTGFPSTTPWGFWNNSAWNGQPSYPFNAWYGGPIGTNPWNAFGFPAFNAYPFNAFPWASQPFPYSPSFGTPSPAYAGVNPGTPYPFNGTIPNFNGFRAPTATQNREAA